MNFKTWESRVHEDFYGLLNPTGKEMKKIALDQERFMLNFLFQSEVFRIPVSYRLYLLDTFIFSFHGEKMFEASLDFQVFFHRFPVLDLPDVCDLAVFHLI